MKKFRILLAVLALWSGNLGLKAQDVTVTLTSVQQVLPPQALLYMSDPGKYFNITLINNTPTAQDVYLAMDLEQTMPQNGLSVSTPPRRQPQQPYTLSPGQVRQLTHIEGFPIIRSGWKIMIHRQKAIEWLADFAGRPEALVVK